MNKSLLVAFLLCMQAVAMFSQTLIVHDQDTDQPLAGASVYTENAKKPVLTDEKGHADLSQLVGSSRIFIASEGYQLLETSYFKLEESGFRVGLIATAFKLETVVMSASRWDQDASRFSQSVQSITRRDVHLQNPQSAADLLGLSGKVFIQKSQQGGGSPMIRGFGTNRLLYTVDGVRMNTAIFRAGNIQNVISLDPFAMDKTEVLFGPSSVMYGSDAIGAVMSFKTLSPNYSEDGQVKPSGQAVFRYSTANQEKTGHFDVQMGGKRWAMLSSISANEFEDLKMGSHGPQSYLRPFYVVRQDSLDVVVSNPDPRVQRPSAYSQMNLMQKLKLLLHPSLELRYDFHYSETSDYGRYDRHLRTQSGLPRYGRWDYGPQIWMMNHLSLEHKQPNKGYDRLMVHLAHQKFGESRVDRGFNEPLQNTRKEQVDAWSFNADFIKSMGSRHIFQYGMEAVLNKVQSTGQILDLTTGQITGGPSRYPQADWFSAGAYLHENWAISDKINLNTGLRVCINGLDARFDTAYYPIPFTQSRNRNNALTGSLGATFRPSPSFLIQVNLSSAYRAPNVDDVGKVFDSSPGNVVVPNPDLNAERALCAEVGVAKTIADRLKVSANLYHTVLNDIMVLRDFNLGGEDSLVYDGALSRIQAIQNGGTGRVWGAEGSLELQLAPHLYLQTQANWMSGDETQTDGTVANLRHVTPWYGSTRLTYLTNSFSIQVYALYSGGLANEDLPVDELDPTLYATNPDGNPYAPGWYTFNFKSTVTVTEALRISAGIENLLDVRYRPLRSGICAPGRNFILSLRTVF
jgi:hemoglobin/transferrin/lactoferrin receptor protein